MSIAEQLTQTMEPLLDAVYAAGKAAGGGGTKNRREYSGEIVSEVVGSKSYVTLVQDELLKELRTFDTLFVRVECNIKPTKYTVVKNWAVNEAQEVIPSSRCQLIYRYDSDAITNLGYNAIPLSSESVPDTGGVGLLKITADGELLFYSGSTSYTIRPCEYKVIVEW